jgi:hypothetical protein
MNMKIDEIFDTTFSLVSPDPAIEKIIKAHLTADGYTHTMIYQVADDPTQVYMLVTKDGAWEVHHAIAEPGKNFISGLKIRKNEKPNPKFIATAIQLYQSRLTKGQAIRVVGTLAMWPTYQAAINRLAKNNAYVVEPKITTGDMHSQVIKPRGKFEGLTSTLVPILK